MQNSKSCASCGAPFVPSGSGARSCYCLPCRNKANAEWKARKAAGQDTWICEQCGEPFKGQKRKYCSYDCRYERKYGYRRHSRTKPPAWTECPTCGETFRITHDKKKFCSRKCSANGRTPRPTKPKSTPITFLKCPTCDNTFIGNRTKKYCSIGCRPSPYLAKGTRVTVPCDQCGKPFTYTSSSNKRTFCSAQCRSNTPNAKRTRRAFKARRRAQKRTTQVERFTHVEIFERDKWRCHICRKLVSKHKVAPHPKAATIDHLIPLSKGGAHTKANVRCACWQCNVLKNNGTTTTGEQLLLIG